MKILSKYLFLSFFIIVFLSLPTVNNIANAFSVGGFKVSKGDIDDALDWVGAALVIPTGGLSLIPGAINDGDLFGISPLEVDKKSSAAALVAKAQECLSKPLSELEDDHKKSTGKAFVYSKVGHASVSQKESDKKNEICESLINAEGDEEDTTYSESFLWKPKSDSDGNAVSLLPTSLMGQVIRVQLYKGSEPNITKVEAGRFTGNANGHRPHYRYSKPGSSYGGPAAVEAAVPEGIWVWLIKNAGQRTEGIKGKFYTNAEIAAALEAKSAEEISKQTTPINEPGNSCPIGQTDTNTNKSLKIMAMGDSNTEGIEGSNNLAYRKAFKEKLTAKGYTVDMVGSKSNGNGFSDNQHEGYSGKGIAQLQSVVDANSFTTYNPDVILLLVGSNDMWVAVNPVSSRTPVSDAVANSKVTALGTLLDTIHTKLPNAKIIVAKPETPAKGGWAATRPLGIYKTGISTLAQTRSYVSVVDFTGFDNDGTHYSVAGYDSIAETFANKVDEITRKCTSTTNTATTTTYGTKSPISSGKLEVECKVSDTTPAVDEDTDIWLEVSGGTTPYDGTWSGDYKKADNFDKDSADQTVSFDKKGSYKIKVTVEDGEGEKAKDTCPTIRVSDDGEDDDVTVRVKDNEVQNNNNSTTSNSQTSNYSFYRDLTMGSQGEDVIALQDFLISTGYLIIPAGVNKGYFGELTKTALGNWQKARGITPDTGYFGPKTRAAIMGGSYVNSPVYNAPAQTYTAPVVPVANITPVVTTNSNEACVDLPRTLYFGEENEYVGQVQRFLVNGGYLVMPAGASYGYYGRTTVTALSKFMAVRGIAHNGAIMDAKVLEQIKSVSCVN